MQIRKKIFSCSMCPKETENVYGKVNLMVVYDNEFSRTI